jgi:hypothetical protein
MFDVRTRHRRFRAGFRSRVANSPGMGEPA